MKGRLEFRFWDLLSLTWLGASASPVPDFQCLYDGFCVQEKGLVDPPLSLTVEQGMPEKDLLAGLERVAPGFATNGTLVCMDQAHGGLAWRVWIEGLPCAAADRPLEMGRVRAWYQFRSGKRTVWPWAFFPDLLICFHVVQPLMEWMLSYNDWFFLHAGAVERDGLAVLLAGRGGVYKTTHVIRLLEMGWRYLSDDLVAMHAGRLYATPMHLRFFEYFRRDGDERLGRMRMLGCLLEHLWPGYPVPFFSCPPAAPKAVNLLMRVEDDAPLAVRDGRVGQEELRRVRAVDVLEHLNYNDLHEIRGRFLLQHDRFFGSSLWQGLWNRYQTATERTLHGLTYREIRLNPRRDVDRCGTYLLL